MLSLKALINARYTFMALVSSMIVAVLVVLLFIEYHKPQDKSPEVKALEQEIIVLKDAVAQATIALDIEQQTIKEMNNTLLSLQSESLEQQLALRFYQKVMAPEYTANGVHIEKVILKAGISKRHVRFEVLVAQLEKRKRYIKGQLVLEVIGSINGKPKSLTLNSLEKSANALKVNFRFFQHIKSDFELPVGFLPERLKVIIKMPYQRGQKSAQVVKEYGWHELIKSPVTPILRTTP